MKCIVLKGDTQFTSLNTFFYFKVTCVLLNFSVVSHFKVTQRYKYRESVLSPLPIYPDT